MIIFDRVLRALFVLFCVFTFQKSDAQPAPPPLPFGEILNVWEFSGTNFLSIRHTAPVTFTNVSLVPTWAGNGLQVDSTNAAWINYPVLEANGQTNLNCLQGTVEMWFSPDWNSADGLGAWATLLEAGTWNTNLIAATGAWGLYISPDASGIYFSAQTNGTTTNYLNAPISWYAGDWHHILISYSPTNSALYLEGQFVTNGSGVTVIPGADVLASGFSIGSDGNGTGLLQARGIFNNLITYDYQLDPDAIAENYLFDSQNVYPLPSSGGSHHDSVPTPPGGGGGGTNGGSGFTSSFQSPVFTTNDLWLTVTVTNQVSYLVIHTPWNVSNGVYDLFETTNLAPISWQWIMRCTPGQTNLTITNLPSSQEYFIVGVTNDSDHDGLTDAFELLVSHSSPTNSDTFGNGIPDGWQWNYFGNFNQTAAGDYDNDGVNNGTEYTNHTDPNKIQFSIIATNLYTRSNSAPLQLNVFAGVPSGMAEIVNDTNFASADWELYSGTNILLPLGTNDGTYIIWIGLRGRLTNSQQTWSGITITRDTMPPVIGLTNPTTSTVSKPIIQLQGWVSENLAGFTYDLSNAAGFVTNQLVSITGQFADTNSFAITTNYFQAYDVPLTNGANIVSLRATDLAGNVTTSNFTFTLDYSGDITPPVITVTYPLTSSLVANTNFTLLGNLDDDTATLTVSNNDGSQIQMALVERGGQFSAASLTLPNPTNFFTLLATDAAGNTSTRQITVVKSSLSLTVDPLSDGQLSGSTITVTGTISDSSQGVWVNGTAATVTGNAWSATISNPNTIDFTALVQAGSDPAHPLADLSVEVPLPPIVQLTSYSDHSFARVYTTCDGVTTLGLDSSTDYVWATGDADPTPFPWLYCALQSDRHLKACNDNLGTADDTQSQQNRSQIQLVVGGPAEIGTLKLIRLLATATTYSNLSDFIGSPVTGSQIQLFGQALSPASTNDTVGETYVVAGAGATQNVPIVVTTANNSQAGYYAFNVQAENVLRIVDASTGIDLTDKMTNVIVGQPIRLICQSAISNVTLSNFQWTVQGITISNYVADINQGEAFSNYDLTTSNVSFYWIGGGTETVQCKATAQGKSGTVSATFDVQRPVAHITTTTKSITIDSSFGYLALEFGQDNETNGPGISFLPSVTLPRGYSGATNLEWIQIVKSDLRTYETIDGSGALYREQATNVLDDTLGFPYPFESPPNYPDTEDNPAQKLAGTVAATVSDSFSMWFLFKPDGGLWVPLRKVNWNWGGTATLSGSTWNLTNATGSADADDDSTDYPQWSDDISKHEFQKE